MCYILKENIPTIPDVYPADEYQILYSLSNRRANFNNTFKKIIKYINSSKCTQRQLYLIKFHRLQPGGMHTQRSPTIRMMALR